MSILLNMFLSMLMMFIFFSPILLISKYFYGLSHKFLIFLICYLNIISVGGLYFRQDIYTDYGWTGVKDFDFTFASLLKFYFPLFIFLVLLIFCTGLLNFLISLFSKKKILLYKKNIYNLIKLIRGINLFYGKENINVSGFMFLLSTIQLVASLIMFFTGKGILGIVPDSIFPFKVIGISYFVSKMFVPLLISLLFIKSRCGNALIIYIFIIAVISGAAQLSRSTFLITILIPYLVVLLSDNKKFLKIILTILVLYGIFHIGSARELIHEGRDSLGMLDISLYYNDWYFLFFESLINIFDFSFWKLSLNNIFAILGRVSSAQGIILSNQFDLNAIGGPLEQFKGIIFHRFQTFDADAFNKEWFGVTLPPGYAAGGDILSKIITFWFHGKMYFLFTTIYIAIWCKVIDFLCSKILITKELGCIFFNFLSTVILLIWIGSSAFYIYFLTLLFGIIFFKKKYKLAVK